MSRIVVDDDLSNIIGIVIIGCMLLVLISVFTYIGIVVTRRFFRPASRRAPPGFGERVWQFFSKLRPVRRRRRQAANDVEGAADAGPPHEMPGENLPEYHVSDPRPPILPPLYGSWSQPLPQTQPPPPTHLRPQTHPLPQTHPRPQTHPVPPRPDGHGQRAPRPLHGPQQPAVVRPGDRWDLGAGELDWWLN